MKKAFRRWLYGRRIKHWQREADHLLRVRLQLGQQLDRALRQLQDARFDLTFLDIERPPISRAPGPGKRDGIDRSDSIPALRRVV